MRSTCVLLCLLLASPALGKVVTHKVPYKAGETELVGYLAYDDALMTPRPGVLVVHEWWGLNDYARQRARELAALGYVAFALDMYGKGETTADPKRAAALAGALKKDTALARARAKAGFEVLRRHGKVDPERMAAIGYCFGGTMALQMAYSGLPLRGVVSFHGHLPTPGAKDALKAKVLVCHGAAGPHVPPAQVQAFQKSLEAKKADWQVISYGGAQHAFTNPQAKSPERGVAHHPAAERRSWIHMREFLGEALAPTKGPRNRGLGASARCTMDRLLSLPSKHSFPNELLAITAKRSGKAVLLLVHLFVSLPYEDKIADERQDWVYEALATLVSSEAMERCIENYSKAVDAKKVKQIDQAAAALVDWALEAAPRLAYDEEESLMLDPQEQD